MSGVPGLDDHLDYQEPEEYVDITATINNGDGEAVTVRVASVRAWSLPLAADWKKAYRPIALDMAAAHIPLPSRGVSVKFFPVPA